MMHHAKGSVLDPSQYGPIQRLGYASDHINDDILKEIKLVLSKVIVV